MITGRRHPATAVCHVLREDADLAEAIPAVDRDKAIEECIAGEVRVPRGRWSGQRIDIMPDGIGLLVLEGLLIRRVGVSGSFGAELLGRGDLLRPWQGEDTAPTIPHSTGWRAIEPVRLAVLDREVARRFARYPVLTGQVAARALERSRNLAMNMAIVHQPRVSVRIHMLLWHLANRWGRVQADGVVLPLRLTHEVIADLVAARRPTVSTALGELAKIDLVRPGTEGWLLLGRQPGALLDLDPVVSGSR